MSDCHSEENLFSDSDISMVYSASETESDGNNQESDEGSVLHSWLRIRTPIIFLKMHVLSTCLQA